MKLRTEGHICEIRCPPKYKTVHGCIEVPGIKERLFFNESLSGIAKSETLNFHLNAKVQFSVDKNDRGFFAKKIYVKVRMKSLNVNSQASHSFLNGFGSKCLCCIRS